MWYRQNRRGYICGYYARHGKIACSQRAIKEEDLKKLILEDLNKMAQVVSDTEYLSRLSTKSQNKEKKLSLSLSKIDDEITTSKSKKNRYLELLSEKQITHEEYRDVDEIHQERINVLNLKRSELKASLLHDEFAWRVSNLRDTINRYSPLTELTEEILNHFVERIDVDKNGYPTVTYRFTILPD